MRGSTKVKIILIMWIIYFMIVGIYVVHIEGVKIKSNVNDKPTIQTSASIVIHSKIIYKEKLKPRYGFTKSDIYILAQVLSGDGRKDGDGEYDIDYQKKVNHKEVNKVLCVVMNRVRSNSFPDTVRGVVLQKRQFDVMPRNLKCYPSNKTLKIVSEWCEKYDAHDKSIQTTPKSHLFYEGNGIINITRRNW